MTRMVVRVRLWVIPACVRVGGSAVATRERHAHTGRRQFHVPSNTWNLSHFDTLFFSVFRLKPLFYKGLRSIPPPCGICLIFDLLF